MTSLSRQLSQLRSLSSVASVTEANTGTKILDTLPGQTLDHKRLHILAQKAFKDLCPSLPHLQEFEETLFPDDNIQGGDDDPMDGGVVTRAMEDLILLLGPHARSASVQVLLEYLIVRHKAHHNHPDLWIISSLPHYEYAILGKVVESIDIKAKSDSYPQWLEGFKRACHPATKIGILKHIACDKGFFKLYCDFMLTVNKHLAKYPLANGDLVTYFFASSVLSALDTVGNISEHQTYCLMQVNQMSLMK